MPLDRPFFRAARPMADGAYSPLGDGRYVEDGRYARFIGRYTGTFHLVQKDLLEIFDFVEPSDSNSTCASFRISALLMRACMEVEANCKAILRENGYVLPAGKRQVDMIDYRKIQASHLLAGYRVHLPRWEGAGSIRQPFAPWDTGDPLPWYQSYNTAKHDLHADDNPAKLNSLVDACCALVAILHAQFMDADPTSSNFGLTYGPEDGTGATIGGYFRVTTPTWDANERYDFKWDTLKDEQAPFAQYPYPR